MLETQDAPFGNVVTRPPQSPQLRPGARLGRYEIVSRIGWGGMAEIYLARGVDAIAHRVALEGGVPTVAVLAGGIDQVYPRENAGLADRIREREWHESQEIRDLPDGRLELKLRLGALPEIERWVLTWGSDAEVVEPRELRERLNGGTPEA